MANAGFGALTDWFGMETAALRLISSSSGERRSIVYASQTGRIMNEAYAGIECGGILRNPSCTYEVIANTTIAATLGDSWVGSSGVSGYMLTSVSIVTAIGQFPRVTFTAVANEGADAINQYAIAVPVVARARPQNLLSAISGGGDLQNFTLTATSDPVVVFEDLMPCASDVTHGKLVASGTTAAYANESAPTAASNFRLSDSPVVGGSLEYKTYTFSAEKGI